MTPFRILGAIGAALAALVIFLVALPDGTIPEMYIVVLGAANAALSAFIVFLGSPITIARMAVQNHPIQLKIAQKENRSGD
jgi:hypothetical protein